MKNTIKSIAIILLIGTFSQIHAQNRNPVPINPLTSFVGPRSTPVHNPLVLNLGATNSGYGYLTQNPGYSTSTRLGRRLAQQRTTLWNRIQTAHRRSVRLERLQDIAENRFMQTVRNSGDDFGALYDNPQFNRRSNRLSRITRATETASSQYSQRVKHLIQFDAQAGNRLARQARIRRLGIAGGAVVVGTGLAIGIWQYFRNRPTQGPDNPRLNTADFASELPRAQYQAFDLL